MSLYLVTYKDSTGLCEFLICEASPAYAQEAVADIVGQVEFISVEKVSKQEVI